MDLSLRQLLELADLAGATRYFQTPAFGAIAPTIISAPQPIRFTEDGFVTGYSGQIESGAAVDYGHAGLRLQIGGSEDLFVDGQGGPAFAGFLRLFGGIPAKRRLVRRIVKGDLWVFTVQNRYAAVTSITPEVGVDFLSDTDMRNLCKALPGGAPAR